MNNFHIHVFYNVQQISLNWIPVNPTSRLLLPCHNLVNKVATARSLIKSIVIENVQYYIIIIKAKEFYVYM